MKENSHLGQNVKKISKILKQDFFFLVQNIFLNANNRRKRRAKKFLENHKQIHFLLLPLENEHKSEAV